MKLSFQKTAAAVAIAASMALTACVDSTDFPTIEPTPTPPPPAATAINVSGDIIKGIVVNAPFTVSLDPLPAGLTNPVAEGRTGTDGSYNVSITNADGSEYTGTVTVVVTADDETQVKCDAGVPCADADNDGFVDEPGALELKNIRPVSVASGEDASVSANANSLTTYFHEIIKQLADDQGLSTAEYYASLSTDQTATVSRAIAAGLGVDPATLPADFDVTALDVIDVSSSELSTASSVLAAMSVLNATSGDTSNGATNLAVKLTNLANQIFSAVIRGDSDAISALQEEATRVAVLFQDVVSQVAQNGGTVDTGDINAGGNSSIVSVVIPGAGDACTGSVEVDLSDITGGQTGTAIVGQIEENGLCVANPQAGDACTVVIPVTGAVTGALTGAAGSLECTGASGGDTVDM